MTSPALQGSHACRFLATNGDIHMETSFAPHDAVSVRFGLHIVEPPPASVAAIVRLRDPSGSAIFTLSMGSLGRLKARNEVTRTTSKSGPALDLDVWHDVEIVLDVSAGSYTVLVDGVAIDRLTDSGTNLGAQPIGHLQLGENAAGQPFDYVVDNVSVDVP